MTKNTQSYCDGVVRIYSAHNAGKPGEAPRPVLRPEVTLRYEERTVGVTRHYEALRAGDRVDLVLRCQRVPVSALEIAIPNDGKQYQITQIQHPRDVEPPCMDLALRRLDKDYDIR